MKLKREKLLAELESVVPGLSQKAVLEQSECFVFSDGKVSTFNDEVFCSAVTCLDVSGAVRAKPLLDLLGKLPDDGIDVAAADGELLVKAKRKKAGIAMESEVLLPVGSVEEPEEWRDVPEGFAEAVGIVSHCAGKDESQFVQTCVHLHPDYLEATDDLQIIRYPMETGLLVPTLVRHASVRHVVGMGAVEVAETDNWLFFRSADGLLLGLRRWMEKFHDIGQYFGVKGTRVVLPQGLDEASERARVFSGDSDVDEDLVTVMLRSDKVRIEGRGMGGWFREVLSAKYGGEPMAFAISPFMLKELMGRSNECRVSEGFLRVDGGKYEVVYALEPTGGDDD